MHKKNEAQKDQYKNKKNHAEEAISTKFVKNPATITSYLWFTWLLHLIR